MEEIIENREATPLLHRLKKPAIDFEEGEGSKPLRPDV